MMIKKLFTLLILPLAMLSPLCGQSIDGRDWQLFSVPEMPGSSGMGIPNIRNIAVQGETVVATTTYGGSYRFVNGTWEIFPGSQTPWIYGDDGDSFTTINPIAIASANNIVVGSAVLNPVSQRGVSHWNGSAWSGVTHPASNATNQRVTGLWADPVTNLVVATLQSGRITYYTGGVWSNTKTPAGGTGDMNAVHGTSASNIWVVGANGKVVHSDNGAQDWVILENLISEDEDKSLYQNYNWTSVFSLDEDRTWFGSSTGEIAYWDGERVTISSTGGTSIQGIYAFAEDQIWIVGSQMLKFYDGSDWLLVDTPKGSTHTWSAITGDDQGGIWVVGNSGAIIYSIPEISWSALLLSGFIFMIIRKFRR